MKLLQWLLSPFSNFPIALLKERLIIKKWTLVENWKGQRSCSSLLLLNLSSRVPHAFPNEFSSLSRPLSRSLSEFVFPDPEDDGGVQARLVRDQRGLVSLPVFPTKQVSRAFYSHAQAFVSSWPLRARTCPQELQSRHFSAPTVGAAAFCRLPRQVRDVNTSSLLSLFYSRQSY